MERRKASSLRGQHAAVSLLSRTWWYFYVLPPGATAVHALCSSPLLPCRLPVCLPARLLTRLHEPASGSFVMPAIAPRARSNSPTSSPLSRSSAR